MSSTTDSEGSSPPKIPRLAQAGSLQTNIDLPSSSRAHSLPEDQIAGASETLYQLRRASQTSIPIRRSTRGRDVILSPPQDIPQLPGSSQDNLLTLRSWRSSARQSSSPQRPSLYQDNLLTRRSLRSSTGQSSSPQRPSPYQDNLLTRRSLRSSTGQSSSPRRPSPYQDNLLTRRSLRSSTGQSTSPQRPSPYQDNLFTQRSLRSSTGQSSSPPLPSTSQSNLSRRRSLRSSTGQSSLPQLPSTSQGNAKMRRLSSPSSDPRAKTTTASEGCGGISGTFSSTNNQPPIESQASVRLPIPSQPMTRRSQQGVEPSVATNGNHRHPQLGITVGKEAPQACQTGAVIPKFLQEAAQPSRARQAEMSASPLAELELQSAANLRTLGSGPNTEYLISSQASSINSTAEANSSSPMYPNAISTPIEVSALPFTHRNAALQSGLSTPVSCQPSTSYFPGNLKGDKEDVALVPLKESGSLCSTCSSSTDGTDTTAPCDSGTDSSISSSLFKWSISSKGPISELDSSSSIEVITDPENEGYEMEVIEESKKEEEASSSEDDDDDDDDDDDEEYSTDTNTSIFSSVSVTDSETEGGKNYGDRAPFWSEASWSDTSDDLENVDKRNG